MEQTSEEGRAMTLALHLKNTVRVVEHGHCSTKDDALHVHHATKMRAISELKENSRGRRLTYVHQTLGMAQKSIQQSTKCSEKISRECCQHPSSSERTPIPTSGC